LKIENPHKAITRFFLLIAFTTSIFTFNLSAYDLKNQASACEGADCNKKQSGDLGLLVIAPDRGYAGNQKVRSAFQVLDKKRNAELLFITDERMRPYLKTALLNLKSKQAKRIIILPLFFSASHPRLTLFRTMLKEENTQDDITYARPFGGSYLAVELLVDRLRNSNIGDNSIIIAGHGASSDDVEKLMLRDLNRIAEQAMKDIGENKLQVIIWPDGKDRKKIKTQEKAKWDLVKKIDDNQDKDKHDWQIVPFHMGKELDGMMSFDNGLRRSKPKEVKLEDFPDNESEFFSLWMQREANRYSSANDATSGIVFNAHGSDFHWNQTMRDAVAKLTQEIPVEFAFSMADSDDLRSAVKRLEDRGVGIITIVRVFGMRTSFRHSVERLIGMDIDAPELCQQDEGSSHSYGSPPKRLRTTALVVTEGGLADSPLFAQALFDRASKLTTNKGKDTVIVVAHGKGRDDANQQWLKVLESLTNQIKKMSNGEFKDVLYQTWREDWEDKRGTRIDSVKKMVEKANKEGGTAIIIPARTTGEGPTKRFLGEVKDDMKYIAGKGFAPHPLFPKWIKQQMKRGLETVEQTRHVWYPALLKQTKEVRK